MKLGVRSPGYKFGQQFTEYCYITGHNQNWIKTCRWNRIRKNLFGTYHVGGLVPESTEFPGRPRKTASDRCKDTESADMILIYKVGKVQGHKTRHLLSCIYVKGFAFLKNNQKHIIIILDINYTFDWGWKSCFKNRKGRKSKTDGV